jgi:Putative peptidoglycan binding domain
MPVKWQERTMMARGKRWALMRAVVMSATAMLALGADGARAQSPPPDYDGRDIVYSMAAGTNLRRGERLVDRFVVTFWERTDIKGAGRCSAEACPVSFNGETLYARRSRLELKGTPKLPPRITRTLRRGDQGPDVKILQDALKDAGFTISSDGNFGRGTEQAVRDYQAKQRLTTDGVAGPQTLRDLGA